MQAEHEIDAILQHLEYQNAILFKLLAHAGISVEQLEVRPATRKTADRSDA